MKTIYPALLVLVLMVLAIQTKAQLIASENFSYSTGNLNGNNGGYGWLGSWLTTTFNASNTQVQNPGLTYTGLNASGNTNYQNGTDFRNFRYLDTTTALALSLMDNVGDPGLTASTNYKFGKAFGKDNTTIWFSFLYNCTNCTATNHSYGGMHLMYGMNLAFDQHGDKKSHQRIQFGTDNQLNAANSNKYNFMISRTINGNANLPGCGVTIRDNSAIVSNTTTVFLVQRIDFLPGKERVFLWINPTGCLTPDTATANIKFYNMCDFRFNAVNVGSGTGTNYHFDELNIGLTYQNVANCATGISEIQTTGKYRVFPNPSEGKIQMEFFTVNDGPAIIQIVNSLGQVILEKNVSVNSGLNIFSIEVPEGFSGLANVHLVSGAADLNLTKTIVIQK